jgi:5'-phosphate synthase pdxT subunit
MLEKRPGVLAFQGDIEEHVEAFKRIGYEAEKVREIANLENTTHLVIPGGESTVLTKFFERSGLGEEIQKRVLEGSLSVFGTCAGLIMLSKKVESPKPIKNLNLIDLETSRNAYGSQINSFEKEVVFEPIGNKFLATFIRAPKVTSVGEGVEILARDEELGILFKQKNVLASTFHPEYLENSLIHKYFLGM